MSDDEPRAMPCDIQAEMGVLGSMMLNPEALELAIERVSPDDFYKIGHQDISTAIVRLVSGGLPLDLIILRNELAQAGKLDKVGGTAYLTEIMEAVPSSANVEYYIQIVKEMAARRALLKLGPLVKQAASEGEDLSGLIRQIEEGLAGITVSVPDAPRAADALPEVDRMMDAWARGEMVGASTGLQGLDDALDGLLPGTLTIVGAEPRNGKTTLACNIALHVARGGQPVMFFTAETPHVLLDMGLLTILSAVEWRQARRGALQAGDMSRWQAAKATLEGLALYVDDTPAIGVDELCGRGLQAVRRRGVRLIVVDYVQLLQARGADKRNLQVALVGAELKRLARMADVPVLALSQVTRDETGRLHLRWARELEQDSDVVIFMGREKKFGWGSDEKEPDVAVRVLKVEKNRFGPEAFVELQFDKRVLRFRSKAGGRQQGAGSRTGDGKANHGGTEARRKTEPEQATSPGGLRSPGEGRDVPDGQIPF